MPTPNIVVLGTGMAGFGAAYRLHSEGITPVMYDKNAYYGGHTASFRYETGFLFDVGPHISFTKDTRIQEALCRECRSAVRDDPDQSKQLLARALASASCAAPSPRNAGRRDRQGHQRFRRRAWRARASHQELCGLAVGEFRQDVRRIVSDAVHAEISHDDRRKHEHRLAWATNLSSQPRRSAARRDLGLRAARSLHHALPLSQRTAGSCAT